MPESPSIAILREVAAALAGRSIPRAEVNAKVDLQQLTGRRRLPLRSVGKQFLTKLSAGATRAPGLWRECLRPHAKPS